MAESYEESELRKMSTLGRRFAILGGFVVLAAVLTPVVMMSIPGIFPCNGECGIGWAGVYFALSVSPVLIVVGIAVTVSGFWQMWRVKHELGPESDRSPERNE
jgi:hypothetical protein